MTRLARYWIVYLVLVGAACAALGASDPPPMYSSGDTVLTNAQPVGRTEGWNVAVGILATTGVLDALELPQIPGTTGAGLRNYWRNQLIGAQARTVTIKRVFDDATDANLAICARLGPASSGGNAAATGPGPNADPTNPTLTCPDRNTATAANQLGGSGGCYLMSTGDSCTFQIRPNRSGCTSSLACHQPLWVVASGGTDLGSIVNVSVAW